jgi:hypothetical protein
MPRDCTFHGAWLRDNEFSSWVEGVDDKCMAHCRLCDSTFSIRNRGIGQLRSHAEKEKHCSLVQKRKNQVVFDTVLNVSGMKEVQLSLPSGPCKVWSLSHGEQICRATALWSMKVAIAGYSFRSCSGIPNLFSLMFPDSLIARDLTLDEDKCSYVIAHGLGPYFHEETVRAVKTSKSCFCLELDETTTSSGDKQLDTYLRFWDEAKGSVVVHYYKSHLLGHAEASVLQSAVLDSFSMDVIPLQRFIHLSSDGPNVNKTLFAFLDAEVKSSRGGQVDLGLLNIGTCNLHVVHNAFACGMGKLAHWSIDTFLKDIYSWMKSSSVRKSDFLDIEKEFSSDGKLPLYYAKWRWLTVVPSVVRAQQLKSDLCRYYLEFVPKQYGLVLQDNEKFVRIQKQLRDPCLDARLHFVATVSTAFESFLRIFQKEGPLVHVLHFSLKDLFMSFLKRFLKAENLDGKSVSELMTLAYEDRNYHLKNSELEVGIHTRASLASLTPEARSGFYSDVRTFFISVANYLSTHLPLKNSLLRDLSALDPVRRCEEASIPRFLRLAGKLSPILDKNDLHLCDHAVSEYKQYVVDPRVDSLAKQWNGSQRVDVDFWSHVFHLKQRDSENVSTVCHFVIIIFLIEYERPRRKYIEIETLIESQLR